MSTNHIIRLNEVESTNSHLMELMKADRNRPQLLAVVAEHQTSGRGQRGNTWSSEAGKNLTFSFLVRHGSISAKEQYAVSAFVAYGLYKTLARYMTPLQKENLSIKWPNDIYYGDRKIGGILIEHSITGEHIDYSIAGIGLNLNQEQFPTDIPNPISLKQITGCDYDPDEVVARLLKRYGFMIDEFLLGNFAEIHQRYMSHLYRRRGMHPYSDRDGRFMASIKDVLPSGHIILEREDGTLSTYAFKEVIFEPEE